MKNKDDIKFKEILTADNESIMVDTSDKACVPFGFKHGERAVNPIGDKVTIMGVGPSNPINKNSEKTLWYVKDNENGAHIWNRYTTNLRVVGFKKIKKDRA